MMAKGVLRLSRLAAIHSPMRRASAEGVSTPKSTRNGSRMAGLGGLLPLVQATTDGMANARADASATSPTRNASLIYLPYLPYLPAVTLRRLLRRRRRGGAFRRGAGRGRGAHGARGAARAVHRLRAARARGRLVVGRRIQVGRARAGGRRVAR